MGIKNIIGATAIALILAGCQTTKQTEKIVISDTLRWNIIDTTRVLIVDTLHVVSTIENNVFAPLFKLVDSLEAVIIAMQDTTNTDTKPTSESKKVLQNVIENANKNIKTTFNYDTNLVLPMNKLLRLKINYYGDSLRIDADLKQLIELLKMLERVEKEEVKEWMPSLWIQITAGVIVFLLLLVFVFYKLLKRN
jgi:hypothetical protein